MSQTKYFDTNTADTVRDMATQKRYRISVRNQVPYITYKRKTRVLFKGCIGAYINVGIDRIRFQ